MSGNRSVRQSARQAAYQAQARLREERWEREKRLSALGVEVMVALRERDAAEQKAGKALQRMVDQEGLLLRETAAWCGEELSQAEARRLMRSGATTQTVEGQ